MDRKGAKDFCLFWILARSQRGINLLFTVEGLQCCCYELLDCYDGFCYFMQVFVVSFGLDSLVLGGRFMLVIVGVCLEMCFFKVVISLDINKIDFFCQ